MIRPFAACERLRLIAPEAPGAHQAPRRGFAASWRSRKRPEGAGTSESWRLPRASPGGARAACDRRGRVSLLPPPSLHPRSTLAPPSLHPRSARTASRRGAVSAHQQKRAANLRWSSSAHSECLTCGRERYRSGQDAGSSMRCVSILSFVLENPISITCGSRYTPWEERPRDKASQCKTIRPISSSSARGWSYFHPTSSA